MAQAVSTRLTPATPVEVSLLETATSAAIEAGILVTLVVIGTAMIGIMGMIAAIDIAGGDIMVEAILHLRGVSLHLWQLPLLRVRLRIRVRLWIRPAYSSYAYDDYLDRDDRYDGDVTYDYQTSVVDVQRLLKRSGYYRGSLDGDFGPGTRAAVRAYQRDHSLPATGSIDTTLLRSLGLS